MNVPPARVRVTAPRAGSRGGSAPSGPGDAPTVYVRSLIRSQLRVAVVAAGSFAVVLAGITAVLAFVPDVREFTVGGIPIAWLVLGAGVYPLVLIVAGIVVRAAERNEDRYRSLAEES